MQSRFWCLCEVSTSDREEEVEAIFGRPRDVTVTYDHSPRVTFGWRSDGELLDVCVNLDTHGRVIGKLWAGEPETFTQKIRRWLHLPNNDLPG